jgi:hypothetical protein
MTACSRPLTQPSASHARSASGDGTAMSDWFSTHLATELYGISFVVLGFVAYTLPRHDPTLSFARDLKWPGAFVNNMLNGFVHVCENMRQWPVTYMSGGAVELTGYRAEEFLSDEPTFGRIIHPDDAAEVWNGVQHFSLVITDYSMPALSGVELARALLRLRPELPILAMSGFLRPRS